MIDLILLSIIVLLCISFKELNIVKLFVFIIPFHVFVKNALFYFYDGGNVFAYWKEIAVIILAFRVLAKRKFAVRNNILIAIIVFFLVTIVYFLLANSLKDALPQLRDHLFTILFFLLIMNCGFTEVQQKELFKVMLVGAFLSAIAGYLQQFVWNIPISTIKGSIDFIDSAGYIQYKTVSSRIMGYERMSGLFSGPNDFGLYCSLMIVICVYLLFSPFKRLLARREVLFIYLVSIMLAGCLVLSFSRAGWAIVIISLVLLITTKGIRVDSRVAFGIPVIFGLTLVVVVLLFPAAVDIFSDSFSGKEASAAARSGILARGFDMMVKEPFGHGLSTADTRSTNFVFFVESAFLNISYEIGVLGLAILLFLHFLLLKEIRINTRNWIYPSAYLALAVSVSSLVVSFFSINTYGMPFVYFWWLILGLGFCRIVGVHDFLVSKPVASQV